ncbi:MAG: MarR family winged helix-turn-helix transcriptional regulator [Gemmataceae bacterium]
MSPDGVLAKCPAQVASSRSARASGIGLHPNVDKGCFSSEATGRKYLHVGFLDVKAKDWYYARMEDAVDFVISQWQAQRPDLDARAMGVVGRILRLGGHFERRASGALKRFELPIWGFDVLGALRRSGKPYSLTPTELMRSVMLSSGAMTNRLDRLQDLDLIERKPTPEDRRSLQVCLTARGLEVVDAAAPIRFLEAEDALRGLSGRERTLLASLLRKIVHAVEEPRVG